LLLVWLGADCAPECVNDFETGLCVAGIGSVTLKSGDYRFQSFIRIFLVDQAMAVSMNAVMGRCSCAQDTRMVITLAGRDTSIG
jgi:hypothetical protein